MSLQDLGVLPLGKLVAPYLSDQFEKDRLRSSEKNISVSCSMAEVEMEEQRRVRNWVGNGENEPICFDKDNTLFLGDKVYQPRTEPPKKKQPTKEDANDNKAKKRKGGWGAKKPDDGEEEFTDKSAKAIEREAKEKEKEKRPPESDKNPNVQQMLSGNKKYVALVAQNPKISKRLKTSAK